jgi:hypothetical protein
MSTAQPRDAATREIARLQSALAEAECRASMRAAFLADMSHEIREPMSGVIGMARLLGETVLDREQRGYVETIIESAETLLTVVNDVLDLSRVDAGRLELEELTFELAAFFARLEALMRPRAMRHGLALAVRIDPALPRAVRGDPGRLRQVLVNLIGNAIKFTEEGGVEVEATPGRLEGSPTLAIEVRDSGPGIPPAAFAKLFTAWGQAGPETARLYGGSGLGLLIARRLVEAMGGELAAANRPEGGACLTVRLPLRAAEAPAEPMPGAAVTLTGASLLVVDAQRRPRELMCQLARGWGLVARAAEGGETALALLREAADRGAPVDFVVIDGVLPDLDPEALARRIRAEPALAHSGLVLLAASGMRGDAARAMAAGFDAYLPKPVTATTLLDCLCALRRPGRGGELITVHSMSEARPRPLRVLLVDDNEVNRRLAAIMLERAGHEVLPVTDGAQAVAAVAAETVDLVLMDVQMPVMDGLEATRRIRALADPARARVPIVAVTAGVMQGDDARCLAAGMDGHIGKPFDRARLLSAVERWGRRAA